ncbi:hypothetical protein [Lacisediminihabitans changchengi]|uniref:hypothetical protein n=1 Tax=Lacisediminihabitans changchengi TaxID=2787634 RepID=UPI001F42E351|nr:hypothetical protein [Lacisediminihabitans changchengi]
MSPRWAMNPASGRMTSLGIGGNTVSSSDLHSREVFARGTHPVAVDGPYALPAATEVHRGFWS